MCRFGQSRRLPVVVWWAVKAGPSLVRSPVVLLSAVPWHGRRFQRRHPVREGLGANACLPTSRNGFSSGCTSGVVPGSLYSPVSLFQLVSVWSTTSRDEAQRFHLVLRGIISRRLIIEAHGLPLYTVDAPH